MKVLKIVDVRCTYRPTVQYYAAQCAAKLTRRTGAGQQVSRVPDPGILLVATRELRWMRRDGIALFLVLGVPLIAFSMLAYTFSSAVIRHLHVGRECRGRVVCSSSMLAFGRYQLSSRPANLTKMSGPRHERGASRATKLLTLR
jgi:hypothetical protein